MAMIRFVFLTVRDVAPLKGETPLGAPRCAASTARPGADPFSASAPVRSRSLALGLAVSGLAGLAASAGHRGAGDGHRVAPSRSPPVLDVEEPSPHGSTTCPAGGPESDSHHVADQSAVGCASHPRRTAEGGHRRLSGHRGEVHDPPPPPALPNLEDVPGEPRRTDHGRRLLRGTDGHVPPALRPGHSRSRASTYHAYRRHRPPDRRVDRATAPGGVSLELSAAPISFGIGIRRSRTGRRRRRR